MDDSQIRQITEEVLSALREPRAGATRDLEARVSALERALRALTASSPPAVSAVAVAAAPALPSHPSFRLLDVGGGGGGGHCLLEPDKPCVRSGQCRQLGH
jgi:hypothetical protein